jgi:NTE family protein
VLGVHDESRAAARALRSAEVLLGTSAGATVGAQIGSGAELSDLFARQLAPTSHEIMPSAGIDEVLRLFEEAARQPDITRALRLIGKRALAAPTAPEELRRSVIAARLPSHDWPRRALLLTAIRVETGERVVFDRHTGVGLVDAVAASCAVPAVWPPVTIGDRRYMDGGLASSANLDVVADAQTVVMLAPTADPGVSPLGQTLAEEAAAHDGRVLTVFADKRSLRAFGRNPLDPECRAPSAIAGREQGRRRAMELAAFLGV